MPAWGVFSHPELVALYQAFSAHMDAFAKKMANGVALISEDPVTGAICGVIMLFATMIFLCAGFLQGAWHPGWVVFVVGGLLCGVVNVIRGAKKV